MVSSPTQKPANFLMSSPALLPQSDDEHFNTRNVRPSNYETVETVPLDRLRDSPDHDDLASLPQLPQDDGRPTQRQGLFSSQTQRLNSSQTQASRYLTQPTQIIDRPSSDISSPPRKPVVQVAASSPMATPLPGMRKPVGYLASAMAPAGTAFRKPFVPPTVKPKPISLDSDDSNDSDAEEQRRSNIKTSTFQRQSETNKVPESPEHAPGLTRFQQIARGSLYRPDAYTTGDKRSSDTLASAYGNASKKPRQTEPSRALPVTSQPPPVEEDLDIDEIADVNTRSMLRRMRAMFPDQPLRDLYEALKAKKGRFDDAVDHFLLTTEKKKDTTKKSTAIDLTGSEDELMLTPAVAKQRISKPPAYQDTRQQARKPLKSITEKYSSTQAGVARKPSLPHKKLDVFDDPGPAPAKARKLVRGRKDRSPPPTTAKSRSVSEDTSKHTPIVLSDGEDEESDSGIHSGPEDSSFDSRLLSFFNTCTALDLSDTASITRDIAEHFVSKRPFRSLDAITKIENPNLKPTKSKRKTPPVGEKIVEKVDEMLRSYEAVDYLVQKCNDIAKPLAAEMKRWGVDIYGKSGNGELDMTSLGASSHKSGGSHDSGIGTPVSDDDRDAISRGSVSGKSLIRQPVSLEEGVQMKDYQVVGINWLNMLFRSGNSCILADDMGLGKTLQTIAFIAHLAETGVHGPHLIVVPAATLENWLKEFQRFCPSLVVEPYYATNPTERMSLRMRMDDMRDEVNVMVTTYTIAKAKDDFPWLRTFGFVCTIFDEGHVLKNADSKVARNLMRVQSKFRLLLTGTPLQNNLKELMSLLNFLMPNIFSQKKDELDAIFKQDVKTINDDAESREMLLSKRRIEKARSMLTPFILRRKKWQVLKDLPRKERKVEYCNMTPEQEEIYHGWLAKAYDVRERRARGERIPMDESANILMKLRQAAIHPLLFRRHYQENDLRKIARACLKDPIWEQSNPDLIFQELQAYSDMEVHQLCVKSKALQKFALHNEEWDCSGKIRALVSLLKTFIGEGHRTLIFSQFVMVLDILELVLSENGIKFFRLDGTTKVSERQDLIDEFNEEIDENGSEEDKRQFREDQVPVFMLSTKAGGAGINLASASRVVIFDSGFNPQDDVQAENRAHRIGQKKEVQVWRLVTRNSVEEQIHGMGIVKLRLDQEVAGEATEDLEGTTNGDKEDNEKEAEGRKAVEDMFFKKLDEQPVLPPAPPSASKKGSKTESTGKPKSDVDEDESSNGSMIKNLKIDGKDEDSDSSSLSELSDLEVNSDDEIITTKPNKNSQKSKGKSNSRSTTTPSIVEPKKSKKSTKPSASSQTSSRSNSRSQNSQSRSQSQTQTQTQLQFPKLQRESTVEKTKNLDLPTRSAKPSSNQTSSRPKPPSRTGSTRSVNSTSRARTSRSRT